MSTKPSVLLFAAALLIVVLATTVLSRGIAATQAENSTSVKNYDECVRAGYPTGRLGSQERCWTPNLADQFVKGLMPTIQQGVYGTVILRTGNCMPTIGLRPDAAPPSDPCRYTPVERRIYVFANVGKPFPARRTPTEQVLKSHHAVSFGDTNGAFYELELPVGQYLLLIEEEGQLYPGKVAVVEPGRVTEKHLTINKATD